MVQRARPSLFEYGVAIASVALAFVLRLLMTPILGDRAPFFPFGLAVLFAAWIGGLWPGVVATALGSLGGLYIFVLPHRESGALPVGDLIAVGIFSGFWVGYHDEIARGLPLIPAGRYDTDLFAAKNLPFLVGMVAESAAEPSNFAPLLGRITTVGLYAALLTLCLAISRRLMRAGELPAALTSLPRLEQVFLVIGSAVISGCFFAGQSVGYRGVFLLLAFRIMKLFKHQRQ